MAWIKLDDHMDENPKVAALNDSAFRAYVEGLCYAARNLTDGWIPLTKVRNRRAASFLVEGGLWEYHGKAGYRIHDYLEYNPTRAEVLEKRANVQQARSKAGSKGLANRWQKGLQNDSPVPVPVPVPVPLERSNSYFKKQSN